MRVVVLFTAVAAVVVALAWWLAALPGTVAITFSGYTVTLATSLAAVALIVVVLALYFGLRALGWVLRTPARIRQWRGRRHRIKGDDAITRTLVAIAAGAEAEARREAARARKLLGDTPHTLLLAAEASRLGKREDEAAAIYHALAKHEHAALLGLRGLFRQAMHREAWGDAANIAARAEAAHPGAAWLRDERAQLAIRTGDWAQALRLAGPEAPRDAYATAAANAETDPDSGQRQARRAWKDFPTFTPAALAYATRLRAAGREAKALQTVRDAWTANPHPELAAFAVAPIADKDARAREINRLVAYSMEHPESRLLLARLALDANQWSDARHHLERARQTGLNQKRLWLMLAELEQREHGDTPAGREAQRDALHKATLADPDPAWRCEACGAEHAQWQPICPTCHAAGRVRWGVRPTAVVATPVASR